MPISNFQFDNLLDGENTDSSPSSQALQVQRGVITPSGSSRTSPPYASPANGHGGAIIVARKANKNS